MGGLVAAAAFCLFTLRAAPADASHHPGVWNRTRTRVRYAGQDAEVGRRASVYTDTWSPMRIHVHYDEVAQDISGSAFQYIVTDVLQAAIRWIESALKVNRVHGRLQFEQHCSWVTTSGCVEVASDFQRCGDATIPREHFADQEYCRQGQGCRTSPGGEGISDADFALYVRVHDQGTCSFGGTLAYAGSCYNDDADRPIAGFITFCKTAVLSDRDWDMEVATAVHELVHTLGFSSSAFPFYRDDFGVPRTPRNEYGWPPIEGGYYKANSNTILEETLQDGTLKHYVVLPRVLEVAREHYGCPDLTQYPLEEQGDEGSAFSHWEAHYAYTEVMTPQVSDVARVSAITLALLEDSGWYKPDYSVAGPFHFARGEGCDLFTLRCVELGETPFPKSFCDNEQGVRACSSGYLTGNVGCTHDLMGKALCDTCQHSEDLEEKFQYFSNDRVGGAQEYLSYCPVMVTFSSSDQSRFCRDTPLSSTAAVNYGETFGVASRCVLSSVVNENYGNVAAAGSCHQVQCSGSFVWILVGNDQWVKCHESEEGQQKAPGGPWNGHIVCPSFATICGDESDHGPLASVPCQFPGVLRHGRCACSPGYINEDCRIEDRESSRDFYPSGLSYPQSELVLTAGLPWGQMASFTPTLSSGPTDLTFSVSPVPPPGMWLDPTDGSLKGIPTAAVERSSYTVRAAGGRGAATTTVILTVFCKDDDEECIMQAPVTVTATTTEPPVCHGFWASPQACVETFTYNDVQYTGCTTVDYEGFGWCSHTGVYEGKWSTCRPCGDNTETGSLCSDGWLPPPECAPSFEYLGDVLDGCTTRNSSTGEAWCSHTDAYDSDFWSYCEPCGVGTPAPVPELSPTSSVLTMTLEAAFSDIQEDPGVKGFLDQFASALGGAAGTEAVASAIYSLGSQQCIVDFCAPADCIDPGGSIAQRLVSSLSNSGSALMSSQFGLAYLQGASLFQATANGVEKLWPLPGALDMTGDGAPSGSGSGGSGWWDLDGNLNMLVIVAACVGLGSMLLLGVVSATRRCKSGHADPPTPSARLVNARSPAAAAAYAGADLRQGATAGGPRPVPAPEVFGFRQPAAGRAPPPHSQVSKDETMAKMLDMGYDYAVALPALEANDWRIGQAITSIQQQQALAAGGTAGGNRPSTSV